MNFSEPKSGEAINWFFHSLFVPFSTTLKPGASLREAGFRESYRGATEKVRSASSGSIATRRIESSRTFMSRR